MTNLDLIEKMKDDLEGYQVGLHTISLERYRNLMFYSLRNKEGFQLTGADISEEAIAAQIMREGLRVSNTEKGLKSTVKYLWRIDEDSLDYNCNGGFKKAHNIIVGVPFYLPFEGEEYFVGDLTRAYNVGNMRLFNPRLPREFIYGYATRKVDGIVDADCGPEEFLFGDDVEFLENPMHYSKLSEAEKIVVAKRILLEKKRALQMMKAVKGKFGAKIFMLPEERRLVRRTKDQERRLSR